MKIGELIRYYRCARDMSQVELANRIGESKQTVYKYETGVVKKIPLEKIIKIANALEISVNMMLDSKINCSDLLLLENPELCAASEFLFGYDPSRDDYNVASKEKIERFDKLVRGNSAQSSDSRNELPDRERRLVAAYRNAPDNIKTGVDAILEPFAEKTDVSAG